MSLLYYISFLQAIVVALKGSDFIHFLSMIVIFQDT